MTKSALLALYLSLFSIAIWVIFDLYQNYAKVEIPQEIEKVATPISDSIDVEMLQLLKERSKL